MANSLLEIVGLTKSFPGVTALDGVDFALRGGEIHALMGENGAGKSTLIKVLTGVFPRDAGETRLEGKIIAPRSPREAEGLGISTVYQEVNLIPHLSVAENICLGRQPTWLGVIRWPAIANRARAALARLDLSLDVNRQLSAYSIAVQQLIAIARALDISAKLLILDEPTSSLDRNEVEELFKKLRKLRAGGLGIIFITHFIDQVYEISDLITVLRNGCRIGCFATKDLPRIKLVSHMIGKAVHQVEALEQKRASAASIRSEAPMLEARGLARKGSLRPLDLDIRPGEVVGLAGLLGSGRTETAKLLFGVDRADQGTVRMNGREVRFDSPRAAIRYGIALTPEDRKVAGIIPNLTVRENIVLALQTRRGSWRRLSVAEQAKLADRFIQALGIKTPSREQTVRNLSGGNQQKVLLARWLAIEPKLFILDEPTRGIDVGAKSEIERLIQSLRQDGLAVLFISSELEEVVRQSQRVVVLRDRRKVDELREGEISEGAIMQSIANPNLERTGA
ncbi:MAG: sugar ABC transporter ATP-binding protein [Verrucomicrobia bacterium]|nr:sugar ABC transporter ATP-binding protein [Verrucomicrobiota bacterium]MBV8378592.1 sugar ABC transporter ATP-binding protein [Verrucomicrobiota bacterium]